MNFKEIEADLIKTCDKAIALGWKIAPNGTCNHENETCCPLGAHNLIEGTYDRSFTYIAAVKYLWSYKNSTAFVDGFDNAQNHGHNPYYLLGVKLRKKYIPNGL